MLTNKVFLLVFICASLDAICSEAAVIWHRRPIFEVDWQPKIWRAEVAEDLDQLVEPRAPTQQVEPQIMGIHT